MSIKVLVTGANGQLAKTIEKLYKKNKDGIAFIFATKKELNILDVQQVKEHIESNNFDYCINCAAYTNIELAEKTPDRAFQINAEAVKNLAKACKENGTVFIHISTDYVFDGEKETPYAEDDKPNPINEYGKSKLLGEQYIQEILDDYFIIRTSWLFSNYGKNFLKTVINNIKENKDLNIIASQQGAPTSTYNLTKFIYFLIKEKVTEHGLYHFSDKEIMSWYDFSKFIVNSYDKTKLNLLSSTSIGLSKTNRPKYSALNNNKRLKIFNKEALLDNSVKEVISLL